MEVLFGKSFSDVRVHIGAEAASIGALAFTHGSNIYFAPGQYNPGLPHGRQLLGHELAHVVQQRSGRVLNPFATGVALVQDAGLEAEAQRMGIRAATIAGPPSAPAKTQRSSATVQCSWEPVNHSPTNTEYYHKPKDDGPADQNNRYSYYGKNTWVKETNTHYKLEVYNEVRPRGSDTWTLQRNYSSEKRVAANDPKLFPQPYNQPKAFDVSGRARKSKPGTKLVHIGSPTLKTLAETQKIDVEQVTPNTLKSRKASPGKILEREAETYKLYAYPGSPRTPVATKPKKPKSDLAAVNGDKKISIKKIYRNSTAGVTSPSRSTVMGGSALDHAFSVEKSANKKRWEWLHLVAHSLGGNNAVDNLVAGTFDGNTGMIPLEKNILNAKANLKYGEYIEYKVEATLEAGTHIANKIDITATFPPRFKCAPATLTIDPLNNTKLSSMTYHLAHYDLKKTIRYD